MGNTDSKESSSILSRDVQSEISAKFGELSDEAQEQAVKFLESDLGGEDEHGNYIVNLFNMSESRQRGLHALVDRLHSDGHLQSTALNESPLEATTPAPVHVQEIAEVASGDIAKPNDQLDAGSSPFRQLDKLRIDHTLTRESFGSFTSFGSDDSSLSLSASVAQCDWTPDCVSCEICSVKFSMTKRRHHCRKCGKCICKTCSPKKMSLEGYKGLQRVCCTCNPPLFRMAE